MNYLCAQWLFLFQYVIYLFIPFFTEDLNVMQRIEIRGNWGGGGGVGGF
jgi:hypothetical protein